MRKEFQLPLVVLLVLVVSVVACKVEKTADADDAMKKSEQMQPANPLDAKLLELQKASKKEVLEPESSLLARMEYYPVSDHMVLYFQRNPQKAYLYQKVSAQIWSDFKAAQSKGKFFTDKIRDESQYQMNSSISKK